MSLDGEMLAYIAKLAALELGTDESEDLRKDLSQILGYVHRIQGHQSGTPPEHEEAVYRRPDVAKPYPSEQLFSTASAMKDGLFSTPVVTQSLSNKATSEESSS